MVLGFFFATPPGFLTPDDFLNITLAVFLTNTFGFSHLVSLTLTYTVVAWGLIMLGALVYPYNTTRLIRSKERKVGRLVKRMFSSPAHIFFTLAIFYLMWVIYQWYYSLLV